MPLVPACGASHPRGSPLLLCLLLSLSCPSLLLALYLSPGCGFFFFLPLITPSYPSSPHHFPSRRTSVFFISETCQRGPNIIAVCASIHSGRRVSERANAQARACMRENVQIRQGAHHSGTRERRRQRLLSCTATHCVCKEPLSLLAERRYALLTSGEGKTYGHVRRLSAGAAIMHPPHTHPHLPQGPLRQTQACTGWGER